MDDTKIRSRERLLKALTKNIHTSLGEVKESDLNVLQKTKLNIIFNRALLQAGKTIESPGLGLFRKKGEE